MSVAQDTVQVTIIQPTRGWLNLGLAELWKFRELVFFLIWRDVKVRYKQTLLGAAWAILKPFFIMVVFSVIFGRLAGIGTDDAPGPLFYFAGLLPWVLFQDGVSKAGGSLVTGRNLITKIYFPRLAVPLASVLGGLVDFAIALLVMMGMMAFYGSRLGDSAWSAVFFLLLTLITALGTGLWLAALNVSYRDVGYVIPFLLQAWLYASPVAYSATEVPEGPWQLVYGLNPMAGAVQGFRWALLGVGQPPSQLLVASAGIAFFVLFSGAIYFRRMERTFADVV